MDVVVPTWLSVWSHAYAGQTSPKNGFFIGIFTGTYITYTDPLPFG